uniref:Peptidase inhibitor 16 n=1 Tax=Schistosoma japonicum TaxID=6182 RepID=C1LUP7_SCHJA|nr:Peptidase inhibitor 16 precursor [Schistosoma japonicum]
MFILFALFILPNIIASDEEKDFRTTMLELHNLHRGYRNECNLKIFRYPIIPSEEILKPLIVQRNTTHVGCAHHQCENFPERKTNIVVCNYAPSSTEDRPYVDGRKGRCKSNN